MTVNMLAVTVTIHGNCSSQSGCFHVLAMVGRSARKSTAIAAQRALSGDLVRSPNAATPAAPAKQTKSELCHFTPYLTVRTASRNDPAVDAITNHNVSR